MLASGPSLVGAAAFLASRSARAEEVGRVVEFTTERSDEGEHTGAFLALAMTPSIAGRRGVVTSLAGYDGGARAGLFLASAEVALWQHLALRVGATNAEGGHAMRPSLGALMSV